MSLLKPTNNPVKTCVLCTDETKYWLKRRVICKACNISNTKYCDKCSGVKCTEMIVCLTCDRTGGPSDSVYKVYKAPTTIPPTTTRSSEGAIIKTITPTSTGLSGGKGDAVKKDSTKTASKTK